MWRRTCLFVVLAVAAIVLASCAPAARTTPDQSAEVATSPVTTTPPETTVTPSLPPTPPVEPPPVVDEGAVPTSKDVYGDLIAPKSYRSWAKAPGFSKKKPGTGPHGAAIQVFVNETGKKAVDGPSIRRWPVGTVIVKDGFVKSGRQLITAYMRKTRDGWYYAEWNASGKLMGSGLEKADCADCHERGDDYVRSFDLP